MYKKHKNIDKIFGYSKKIYTFVTCYPENNLFTLKKLMPIENLERSPVKVIAFF